MIKYSLFSFLYLPSVAYLSFYCILILCRYISMSIVLDYYRFFQSLFWLTCVGTSHISVRAITTERWCLYFIHDCLPVKHLRSSYIEGIRSIRILIYILYIVLAMQLKIIHVWYTRRGRPLCSLWEFIIYWLIEKCIIVLFSLFALLFSLRRKFQVMILLSSSTLQFLRLFGDPRRFPPHIFWVKTVQGSLAWKVCRCEYTQYICIGEIVCSLINFGFWVCTDLCCKFWCTSSCFLFFVRHINLCQCQ